MWTYEHKPKAPEEPDRIPGRRLLSGALISALCGWLVWSLIYYEYFGSFYLWPLYLLTPESWVEGADKMAFVWAWRIYQVIFAGVLAVIFGRVGHWSEVWRRYVAPSSGGPGMSPPLRRPSRGGRRGIRWSGRTCGPRGRTVRLIGWRRTHGRGR
ncbi:hypothetical protein GCM10017744_035050 [Streptomyces antimycoticus]